jgi:hypothetical protein
MALKLSERNQIVNIATADPNKRFWKPSNKVEIMAITKNLREEQLLLKLQ